MMDRAAFAELLAPGLYAAFLEDDAQIDYVGDPDENADDDEGDLCLDFIGEYDAPAAPDEEDEI